MSVYNVTELSVKFASARRSFEQSQNKYNGIDEWKQ